MGFLSLITTSSCQVLFRFYLGGGETPGWDGGFPVGGSPDGGWCWPCPLSKDGGSLFSDGAGSNEPADVGGTIGV